MADRLFQMGMAMGQAAAAQGAGKGGFGGFGGGGGKGGRQKKDQPCKNYVATGRCSYGEDCIFRHSEEDRKKAVYGDDDDDDGFITAASKRSAKTKGTKDGAKVDFYGIRKKKGAKKVLMVMPDQFVEDVTELDEDEEHTHVALACPVAVIEEMEMVMDHLNGELKGRPLGKVRQKRLAGALVTTCEATGAKPRERIKVDGSIVSGDETDDKFMKALGGIKQAMKENAQHQSEMMKFVLEKKKGGSPGKGRSPSGLLRKKARSGASASSSAGASGSAGPLVRNLFEIGSDEEDEDEMEEDDAQQGGGDDDPGADRDARRLVQEHRQDQVGVHGDGTGGDEEVRRGTALERREPGSLGAELRPELPGDDFLG